MNCTDIYFEQDRCGATLDFGSDLTYKLYIIINRMIGWFNHRKDVLDGIDTYDKAGYDQVSPHW